MSHGRFRGVRGLLAGAWLIYGLVPVAHAQTSLADRLKAVQSGEADSPVKLPVWEPVGPSTSAEAIPMAPGLIIVTAVNQAPWGDYESIKSVLQVDAGAVLLHYSANLPKPKMTGPLALPTDIKLGQADPSREFPDKVSCMRSIDAADLANAHNYSENFCQHPAEHFPGTTSISASTELLTLLRAGATVPFHFAYADKWAVFAQQGALFGGGKPVGPQLTLFAGQWMYSCDLRREGGADVAFPVLLNDRPAKLPALHASCAMQGGGKVDFYWLDQPSNPVTLAFQIDGALLQTISISSPRPQAAPASSPGTPLERALSEKKPVPVYGIYFDFNSASIKPESEPVLREIAGILRKNPDWRLSLGGHTDSIGNDRANLVLSQQRTAAVKQALVARYQIAPDRLVTSGYGAAGAIAPNDTLEGRARNRRVELQRL